MRLELLLLVLARLVVVRPDPLWLFVLVERPLLAPMRLLLPVLPVFLVGILNLHQKPRMAQ